MDVAGAEALRRRIEETTALGRPPGSTRPAGARLTSRPRDDVFDDLDGDEQFGCVRPALRQWLEHHERMQAAPPPARLADGPELNGGGAGALRARIEQQQRADGPAGQRGSTVRAPAATSVSEILARGRRRRAARWRVATVATSVSLSLAAAAFTSLALQKPNGNTTTTAVVHLADWRPVIARTAATPLPVRLHGLASYNPYGSGPEHTAEVANATDGNAVTYWSTETYFPGGFTKPGTGLVLRSGRPVRLARIELETGTPGFQATIRVSNSPDSGFRQDSAWQSVGARTVFTLRGLSGRYWLIWLRLPKHSGVAHINEVRATS